MSTILGVISLVSLGIVTYLSYSRGGVMHGGYGVTGVLATVYSLIGLILGVLTLRDKDIYRFFPVLGTILNVISLGGISFFTVSGEPDVKYDIRRQEHGNTRQSFGNKELTDIMEEREILTGTSGTGASPDPGDSR